MAGKWRVVYTTEANLHSARGRPFPKGAAVHLAVDATRLVMETNHPPPPGPLSVLKGRVRRLADLAREEDSTPTPTPTEGLTPTNPPPPGRSRSSPGVYGVRNERRASGGTLVGGEGSTKGRSTVRSLRLAYLDAQHAVLRHEGDESFTLLALAQADYRIGARRRK
eukprot:7787658-Pyramimonas_sp.AAC.1